MLEVKQIGKLEEKDSIAESIDIVLGCELRFSASAMAAAASPGG
jgi:hypothetical protein